MKPYTKNLLTEIIETQHSFLTDFNVAELLSDPETRSLIVLIRAHDGRHVVSLEEVAELADRLADRGTLRDVSFTADETDRLRHLLDVTSPYFK